MLHLQNEKINGKNDITHHPMISNGNQTKTTHNNKRRGDKEKKYSSRVNSLSTADEHKAEYEPYPDVVDLVEMDYAPARRQTPIHN